MVRKSVKCDLTRVEPTGSTGFFPGFPKGGFVHFMDLERSGLIVPFWDLYFSLDGEEVTPSDDWQVCHILDSIIRAYPGTTIIDENGVHHTVQHIGCMGISKSRRGGDPRQFKLIFTTNPQTPGEE